jgi:hypothetical protein
MNSGWSEGLPAVQNTSGILSMTWPQSVTCRGT